MKKMMPIGVSDFKELIEDGYYYVDKTLFIREIMSTPSKVTLLPRPRRFGKTLNLSMLRYFFEKNDGDLAELFDETAIRDYEVFQRHQGRRPVIWLTFKDVKTGTWRACLKKGKDVIYKEYARHRYLLDDDILHPEEVAYYESILSKKADATDFESSIEYLSEYLNRRWKTKVVILIDEYDTPLQSGYAHEYYEDIVGFMRNFLSGGLKDNVHLFKGVLTGILRVAKESIFSGLNNPGVYTLLSPRFSRHFGFTEDEVKSMLASFDIRPRKAGCQYCPHPLYPLDFARKLDIGPVCSLGAWRGALGVKPRTLLLPRYAPRAPRPAPRAMGLKRSLLSKKTPDNPDLLRGLDMGKLYAEASRWYNGYMFGRTIIYNPWSLINFIDNQGAAEPYWVNTASHELIDKLVTREGGALREELGRLLEGKSIKKPVSDSIVMKDLETRANLLWSFLLFSGYLKPAGEVVGRNKRELEIPNKEVKWIFEDLIQRWFDEKIEPDRQEEMIEALEAADVERFERALREVVIRVMSYHDFSGAPEMGATPYVFGMLVWCSDNYTIRSNRESGYGRYDLALTPKDPGNRGIIMEFKRIDEKLVEQKGADAAEKTLDEALKQIETRRYDTEMIAAGVTDVLKLAVAFKGKELWVKKAKELFSCG